jgi:hypothetical protein
MGGSCSCELRHRLDSTLAVPPLSVAADSTLPRPSGSSIRDSDCRVRLGSSPSPASIYPPASWSPPGISSMAAPRRAATFRHHSVRTGPLSSCGRWIRHTVASAQPSELGFGRVHAVLLVATMRCSLFTPNKSAQPMPGGRRGCRRAPVARHGWLQRSIRMPYHASGWFDRLGEADFDGATQEAATAGALGGHGQGAPRISRISRMERAVRGRSLRVSFVPVRVIRDQNKSGSNQALEPTETRGAVPETAALVSQVSSGLRGSVLRSTFSAICGSCQVRTASLSFDHAW